MEEDRPLLPREVKCPFQLFDIGQHAEPALCVRMSERIGIHRRRLWGFRFLADGELQQRFLSLLGQVVDDIEERILGCLADIVDPLLRHAKSHELEFS